jgi:predicted ferric reductase
MIKTTKMKRSDTLLAIHYAKTIEEKDALIYALNEKIEQIYNVVYTLENHDNKGFQKLGALLRKGLEY